MIPVETLNIIAAVGGTIAAVLSAVAAVIAARAHGKIQQLDIRVDGRMEQLIETAHALGVAQTATQGPQGPQGVPGLQGVQGPAS